MFSSTNTFKKKRLNMFFQFSRLVVSETTINVNSFHVNLFNKLCERTDEIFFFTTKHFACFFMLLVGSNGTNKKQLEEALEFVKDKQLLYYLQELNCVLNYNYEGYKSSLLIQFFYQKRLRWLQITKVTSNLLLNYKYRL